MTTRPKTSIDYAAAVRNELWTRYGVVMTDDDEDIALTEFLLGMTPETTARGIAADIHGITD